MKKRTFPNADFPSACVIDYIPGNRCQRLFVAARASATGRGAEPQGGMPSMPTGRAAADAGKRPRRHHPRRGRARRRLDGDGQPGARRARARRREDAAHGRGGDRGDRLYAERARPQPPRPIVEDGAGAPAGARQLLLHGDHQRDRGAGHRGRLRHPLRRHPRRPQARSALRPAGAHRPGRRRPPVHRPAAARGLRRTERHACRSRSSPTTFRASARCRSSRPTIATRRAPWSST